MSKPNFELRDIPKNKLKEFEKLLNDYMDKTITTKKYCEEVEKLLAD